MRSPTPFTRSPVPPHGRQTKHANPQRGKNAHGIPPLGFSLQKNTHNFAVGYVYAAYFELTHFHRSDLKIFLTTTL